MSANAFTYENTKAPLYQGKDLRRPAQQGNNDP